MNPFSASPGTNKITFQLGNSQRKCVFDHQRQNSHGNLLRSNNKLMQSQSYIEDESFISREMQFTLECYYTNIGYDKKPNVPIQDYKYEFKPYQTFCEAIYQPGVTQDLNTKYKKVMFVKEHRTHYNRVRSERKLFFRKIQDLIYFSLGKMKLGPYQHIQSQQLYTLFCCRKTKPQINVPSYLQSIQYTNRLAYISHLIEKRQAQFQVLQADEFERIKKLIQTQIFQIETMYYWCFQQIHFLEQSFEEIKKLNSQFSQIQNEILNTNSKPSKPSKTIGQAKDVAMCQQFRQTLDFQPIDQEQTQNKIQIDQFRSSPPKSKVHQIISEEGEEVVQINDQSDSSIVNIPKKQFKRIFQDDQIKSQPDFLDIQEDDPKQSIQDKQEQIQSQIMQVEVIDKKIFLKMAKNSNLNTNNNFHLQSEKKKWTQVIEVSSFPPIQQSKNLTCQILLNTEQELQIQKFMQMDSKNQQLQANQQLFNIQDNQISTNDNKDLINKIQRKGKQENQLNMQQIKQVCQTEKVIQEGEVRKTQHQIQQQRSHRNQGFFFPAKSRKPQQDDIDY